MGHRRNTPKIQKFQNTCKHHQNVTLHYKMHRFLVKIIKKHAFIMFCNVCTVHGREELAEKWPDPPAEEGAFVPLPEKNSICNTKT